MLNRIVIINSELYAKASVLIGDNSSIQIAAENNVGKSSFVNALNFLYITDKDQMRFEDDRKLSDSLKHYFDGTSVHSFIIFEIFKNGYYNILVKATPENSIEYYKISGQFEEKYFIESTDKGFKAKKWNDILQELSLANPTDLPVKLSNEELYNLIYNTDKNKNPVVWLDKDVKRNGRKSFSNNFTDIYRHLIRSSEINEKSFRNALLVADPQQHIPLNALSNSSFEKIEQFEKKKAHVNNLKAIKLDFEKLKLLNDEFISRELFLGKLKNTFIKQFDKVENELSDQTIDSSELSIAIKDLKTKVEITLKEERDSIIEKRTTNTSNKNSLTKKNSEIDEELKKVKEYEPTSDNLLYQGLKRKVEEENEKLKELESQLTQLKRSNFTKKEIEDSINTISKSITEKENAILSFDNLLYQNISNDQEIIRKAYYYLSSDVAQLDKSKIVKKISKADLPLTFFDSKIDVSDIDIKKELPTIKQHQEEIESLRKELAEKEIQLKAIKNRNGLQSSIDSLKATIKKDEKFIKEVENKPSLISNLKANGELLTNYGEEAIKIQKKLDKKDLEIEDVSKSLTEKIKEKEKCEADLKKYKEQLKDIIETDDIYEIEEKLDYPFETIHENFFKSYRAFIRVKGNRKDLKDDINRILNKDIKDIKRFIREVDEEIIGIPQMEKIINSLLDTLSHEIGSPTHSFLTQFNDFKTFVYKSYNRKLAEYPVSNIQSVKVKIDENDDLISDLEKISNLKFSDGFDFDNSLAESRKALENQLTENSGKAIKITDLFNVKVEITKVTGKPETIDLSKQVQSRGTNIVLKLYLFLNILKDLVHRNKENRVTIYIDELDSIGSKNIKYLIKFCKDHYFVPIFAAPRKVEGIQKYYMIKEPKKNNKNSKQKITFGELQSFPVTYRDAE
jgi:hypothetical protein